MCLYMLFQILWSLKGLSTKVAFVRLERNVYANVGGNMIAFDRCSATISPLAYQIKIIRAFPSNVALADMFLEDVQSDQ